MMPRKKTLPPGMWQRGRVYYARFRKNGRLVRRRLSTSFDVACEILNELRSRADRADFGLIDNDFSWEELKREFLRWVKQTTGNLQAYSRHLHNFETYLRVGSVRQIDHAYVIGYREWRLKQTIRVHGVKVPKASKGKLITPRTVNTEVATLRVMLNKAVEWKRIGSNPIAGLKPLADKSPRKVRRSLSSQEVESLFAAAPTWLANMLRVFATTGMRRREVVQLRFSDIDFAARTLTVRAEIAKNGKAREIHLDDNVLAILREQKAYAKHREPLRAITPPAKFSRDHVFVSAAGTPFGANLLKSFYAACKRAGIADGHQGGSVDLHSLRVTFATLTIENGASPKAIQAILGHSTLGLTMAVYAKATEKAKRDAIAALPFAVVSPPDHVVILEQKAPEKRTVSKSKPQIVG